MTRAAIAEARAFESWQDYQDALKRAIAPLTQEQLRVGSYLVCARLEKSPNISFLAEPCICAVLSARGQMN